LILEQQASVPRGLLPTYSNSPRAINASTVKDVITIARAMVDAALLAARPRIAAEPVFCVPSRAICVGVKEGIDLRKELQLTRHR
jgi:hypothetical protein